MSKKIKLIIAISLSIIALSTIVYGTYAFFTSKDTKVNTLTIANQDIDLNEPNWSEEDAISVTPGKVVIKDPTLSGVEGENYARIIVEFYDTKTNEVITDETRLEQIKRLLYFDTDYAPNDVVKTPNLAVTSTYSLSDIEALITNGSIKRIYNNEDFILDTTRSTTSKMYFNYKNVLKEGDIKVLFTNIAIPTDFTSSELQEIGNFRIDIYAEGIQVANIDSQEDAYTELDGE